MTLTNVTQENFQKEVVESEIPVIADFWASWCGPCKLMGPIFEDLSGEFEGRLKFVKINIGEEEKLPSIFQVQGIPSLIVMDKGKEVDRMVGMSSKESLKESIEDILKGI